ncbi:F0F1 ATP synthase subunit delta [Antarcticimicrobium sediminis]|uniref:ATP synthase subunit b n=1 Tax=Antarcticimicrobium sediminis TaxID=2546227 RepID=A0A4R5F0P8_9RHOB|nr:F0F1 ATP synthase subunit delta [Antarcticimicrobium sediminis]TDE41058.1 ATPase [Antarcticimicrobium sediminis]
MTLDVWGLGLQAVNVLILVWLLGRVFWRPVAGAIARRQDVAQAMLDEGKTAQAKANAALHDVTTTRAGMVQEREDILAEARATAEAARKVALAEAQAKADALMEAAKTSIARETETARKENAARASELSIDIAAKLLDQLATPLVQAAFLAQLVKAITGMSASDRAALVNTTSDLTLVVATDLADAEKARIEREVAEALGGAPQLQFVTEPDLIAGLELRSAHFVLKNSWRADLERILKELKDAA